MRTLTCLLILFPIYVTASGRISPMIQPLQTISPMVQPPQTLTPTIQPPQIQPRTGQVNPDVVAKACEGSPEKELCILVLKSQNISKVNDLKQATFVAILTASGEAVTTSNMIKNVRKRRHSKEVDGIEDVALVDCSMNYVSLVKMLSEASSALMNGQETVVMGGVKAAMSMAEACDKSIVDGRKTPVVDQVVKMNEKVRRFCSNALSVYNVYANATQQ